MNFVDAENYLLVKQGEGAKEELFKLAVHFAEKSNTVLYISSKPLKSLPAVEIPDRDVLKRIIFMYFEQIHQLTGKLLELHSFSITPKLIIMESLHEFKSGNSDADIDKHSLAISALFNGMQYLRRQLGSGCTSVVSVDSLRSNVNLQILVDLYYYKTAIYSLDSIFNKDV